MSLGGDGYDGEAWMGGVVPQQQEVARLQEEVTYLKEQCEQWRKMAEGHVPIDERSEAPLLNSEVEQLRREVEVGLYVCTCMSFSKGMQRGQSSLCCTDYMQNNLEQDTATRE